MNACTHAHVYAHACLQIRIRMYMHMNFTSKYTHTHTHTHTREFVLANRASISEKSPSWLARQRSDLSQAITPSVAHSQPAKMRSSSVCGGSFSREFSNGKFMCVCVCVSGCACILFFVCEREIETVDHELWMCGKRGYIHAYIMPSVCAYMHAYIYIHTQTYVYVPDTHTHTYTHTCIHAYMHTYIHTYIQAQEEEETHSLSEQSSREH